jgi:hypothetical protein
MVQLGWKAGTERFRPGELLEFAIAAEEAGFDSIDASDHFQPGCLSPDAEEHVRFVRSYLDLGFDQVFFHSTVPDQQAFLAADGRDVLPRLRREATAAAGRAA